MQIRRLLFIFLMGSLLLAGAIMVMAVTLRGIQTKVEDAQQRRHESYQLADELRQSSDDLTRFARTYAVTATRVTRNSIGEFSTSAMASRFGQRAMKESIGTWSSRTSVLNQLPSAAMHCHSKVP